jgi:hypothetical protein
MILRQHETKKLISINDYLFIINMTDDLKNILSNYSYQFIIMIIYKYFGICALFL